MSFPKLLLAASSLAIVASAVPSRAAGAQTTATQVVTFAVNAINQVAFSGAPSLIITAATTGSGLTSVTSAAGPVWSVTTNQSTAKITASLGAAMPTGLTLKANLTAAGAGTSAGLVALGTSPVDVVTGITKVSVASMPLSYQLDATAAAGVVASSTVTVTYTITGGT
jgi:hypothetical protein